MTIEHTEVPGAECPSCHKTLDMATGEGGRGPRPGDVTLCLYCGHILVFGDGLKLRDPNDAEMHQIAGNKMILRAQKIRVEALKRAEGKS